MVPPPSCALTVCLEKARADETMSMACFAANNRYDLTAAMEDELVAYLQSQTTPSGGYGSSREAAWTAMQTGFIVCSVMAVLVVILAMALPMPSTLDRPTSATRTAVQARKKHARENGALHAAEVIDVEAVASVKPGAQAAAQGQVEAVKAGAGGLCCAELHEGNADPDGIERPASPDSVMHDRSLWDAVPALQLPAAVSRRAVLGDRACGVP